MKKILGTICGVMGLSLLSHYLILGIMFLCIFGVILLIILKSK